MKLCYDIECNGLDPDTIWMIVAQNLDTKQIYKFSDHATLHGSIADGAALLSNAELLVGHNIIGFDNRVVDKLCGTDLNSKRIHDTFVMSQVLRYQRPHRHGLAGWGEALGNKKGDFHEWDSYSPEMLKYCIQDVAVNVDVYNKLLDEYRKIFAKNPKIKEGLKVEHDCAIFNARARSVGWQFDVAQAIKTEEAMSSRILEIEGAIEPLLGMRKVYIDKEPRTPKYKKNGEYNSNTVRILSEYFHRIVTPRDTHMMAPGTEFQRSKEEQIKLGSTALVKDWLLANGWVPDEYQKKKIGNDWINMGPKLTTTSLVKQGPIGVMIDEYTTIKNRRAVVQGWLSKEVQGRLHGNMWTVGTPTFRCRHEVIVNLPGAKAAWGKELRSLLAADVGSVIVGADSSGNQLRGLCHYVGNSTFTNEVCFGDQHQRNADALGCDRDTAKSYLYAYLFGAGDGKLGQVLTGKNNPGVGKSSKEKFARGIRGLKELREKLSKIWKSTCYTQGTGWIPAIDGRPVFCPSEHQVLNYLLQSAEGISCKAALSYQMQKIAEEGLRATPRLFYHDEAAWNSHPEDADRVGEILQESFKIAPKWFGIECMDGGDYVIGDTYADVH